MKVGGDPQRPAGRGARPGRIDAGVNVGQGQLAGLRIGLEHAEVGDHLDRTAAAQAETLAVARPVAEPDRRDEVDAFDERAQALAHDHDDLAAGRGDLGRATRAGQPHAWDGRSRRR